MDVDVTVTALVRMPGHVRMETGKLECLSGILDSIISAKQRCVLVSTSTVALTLIELVLCIPRGYTTVRIDGDTKVSERQNIVDGFNARGRGQVKKPCSHFTADPHFIALSDSLTTLTGVHAIDKGRGRWPKSDWSLQPCLV